MELWFCTTYRKPEETETEATVRLEVRKKGGGWEARWNGESPEMDGFPSVLYEGESSKELAQALRGWMRSMRRCGFVSATEEWFGRRGDPDRKEAVLLSYAAGHSNESCLRLLRSWRRERAARERKPAFMVATNGMLEAAAAFLPQTEDELGQLPGFSARKIREYGKEILEITSQFRRQTDFPLDWVERLVDDAEVQAFLDERRRKAKEARSRREALRESILEAVESGFRLEKEGEALERFGVPLRRLLEAMEALEREGFRVYPLVERLAEAVPEPEKQRVFETMQSCGDRYLKPVLESVYSAAELKERPLGDWYDRLRLLRFIRRYKKDT